MMTKSDSSPGRCTHQSSVLRAPHGSGPAPNSLHGSAWLKYANSACTVHDCSDGTATAGAREM